MIIENHSCIGEGLHSWYHYIGNGIGAKVYKRSNGLSMAQREYLFNIYAQKELPGVVNEVYACGMVHYGIKKKIKLLPVIWMNHIEGITCEDYFDGRYGDNFNIIEKISEICSSLKRIGFIGTDHELNDNNFMITKEGNHVLAIDFSFEVRHASKELRKKVYELYAEKLNITSMPMEMASIS